MSFCQGGCIRVDRESGLWLRRSHTGLLSGALSKTASIDNACRAMPGLLDDLTPREYGTAICAWNGESNWKIAQSRAVTERTVKARLTGDQS